MRIIIFFGVLFSFISSFGQNNIGFSYNNYHDLSAAKSLPASLDFKSKHGQAGFNYSLWVGNSSFDYKTANDIYQSGKIDNQDISHLLDKVKAKNIFGTGQEMQVVAFAYRLSGKENRSIILGGAIHDKAGLSLVFPKEFMQLVLKGNKQFAGQTIDLGPSALNFNYRREYAIFSAVDVLGSGESKIRVGARLKYLQGIAALYMPKANATLFTEKDGKYIDMTFDYNINTSGTDNFSPFHSNGKGVGLDLGTTFFINKNFEASANVLDIGGMNYTKDTRSYSKTADVRYEGLVINKLFGNNAFNEDSLANIFNPDKGKDKKFHLPLDTKIRIDGVFKTTKKDTKRDIEYVNNAVYLTYVQGLNNMPGATTRPYVSVGYNHEFPKLIGCGGLLSAGGYNRFALGAFFAFKLGRTTRLGFSSDNLITFVRPNYGSGVDFGINFLAGF